MYSPTQPAIVEALEAGGAIEVAPYYAGVKAKGYRLAKRFLGDRSVRVPVTDVRLIDRIERERQRHADEQDARWKPIHFALDQEQRALTITDDADRILDALPVHVRLCQHVLVSRIRCRELPFSVSSTGRCFNSITGLKRDLRTALRLDGEPMGSVDIRCAQPALLAMLLSAESPSDRPFPLSTYKHTPGCSLRLPAGLAALLPSCDSSMFASVACDGILYELLMSCTGLDRDSVKLAFLRDVLAKRGKYPSVVESAFQAAFPTVLKIIREVNRRDHGDLIRLLQRAEAWLVIEQVVPRLLGKARVVTLHDAIYSRRSDVAWVAAGFREVFGELGFEIALKVEGD